MARQSGRPLGIAQSSKSGSGGEAFVAMVNPADLRIAITLPRFGGWMGRASGRIGCVEAPRSECVLSPSRNLSAFERRQMSHFVEWSVQPLNARGWFPIGLKTGGINRYQPTRGVLRCAVPQQGFLTALRKRTGGAAHHGASGAAKGRLGTAVPQVKKITMRRNRLIHNKRRTGDGAQKEMTDSEAT